MSIVTLHAPMMTHWRRVAMCSLSMALLACATAAPRNESGLADVRAAKPRVVVTADPELDDSNSMLRYLLHSTDFRTEGLIYASSQFHWKGDGTGKRWFVPNREYRRFGLELCPCESWRWAPDERFIDEAVETYARVYSNLRVHDPHYPTPAELTSKIRWGNVEFDGDMSKDTPGSDLIKALLLDDEPGPIYLLAWGGESTIARALKSIQDEYEGTPRWSAIRDRVSRKAILSASGDQDDTYAKYIRPNWPDIRSLPAGVGGVPLAYGAGTSSAAENALYYGVDWTRENVSSRGPLGARYRVWGDGKKMVKDDVLDYFGEAGLTAEQLRTMGYKVWLPPRPKGEFLGEGDTFTYLNLVDNGLLGWRDDTPGGWAGRGRDGGTNVSLNSLVQGAATRPPSPDPNFTPAAQNELAARMKWSVTPKYADANHPPRVAILGSARISARPGETIDLQGVASDPDGNTVHVRWWQWKDVDSYPGQVALTTPTSLATRVVVPADAVAGQSIQVVLEASDDGVPPLTRYQRVVISVIR